MMEQALNQGAMGKIRLLQLSANKLPLIQPTVPADGALEVAADK